MHQYDQYRQSERYGRKFRRSPVARFYKSLRGFVFFNATFMVLRMMGVVFFVPWKVSIVWALILGFQYIRAFGWPGTDGVMSDEWGERLEDFDKGPGRRTREEPEPMTRSNDKGWREKDLV